MFDIAVDVLFDFGDRFAVSRARVRLLGIVRTLSVVVADVVRFHLLLDVFEHSIETIETKDRRSVQKWLDFFVLRFGSDLVVGSLDFLEDFRMTLFGFHIQMFVRVVLFTQSSIRAINLLRGRRVGHAQYTVWIRHSFLHFGIFCLSIFSYQLQVMGLLCVLNYIGACCVLYFWQIIREKI